MTEKKRHHRSFMSRHPKIRSLAYGFYALLFALLALCLLPLGFIPRGWTYKLGRLFGLTMTYALIRKRCLMNLFYAYGEKMTDRRAKCLTKKVAINVTYSVLDCFYLWVFKSRLLKYNLVEEWSGWELIDRFRKEGKGIVVATAHYHCFEIMPVYFYIKGEKGGVIARTFPSKLAVKIYTWLRKRYTCNSFYSDAKGIIRTLREGSIVGVLPDLYAKRNYKVPTTFYGKPTTTFDIHFRLAALTECPVIPAFLMRKKRNPWQYGLLFYDPIRLPKKPSETEIAKAVQDFSLIFEHHIRRYPTGWIWFHNKWRIW